MSSDIQSNIVETTIKKNPDVEKPVQSPERGLAGFHPDLVKKYPKSNKRLQVDVSQYGIKLDADDKPSGTTTHISPHGLEFRSSENFEEGSLLKIHVTIPDYWKRKMQFVDYRRVDTPGHLKVLAKVVSTENIGKRGKKKMVLCRTVNIDDVDQEVLKTYLREG